MKTIKYIFLVMMIMSSIACHRKIIQNDRTTSITGDTTRTSEQDTILKLIRALGNAKVYAEEMEETIYQLQSRPPSSIPQEKILAQTVKNGMTSTLKAVKDTTGKISIIADCKYDSLLAEIHKRDQTIIRMKTVTTDQTTVMVCPSGWPKWIHLPDRVFAIIGIGSMLYGLYWLIKLLKKFKP